MSNLKNKITVSLMFIAGAAILIFDAWIRHARCITVGVVVMTLAIIILMMIDDRKGKKNILKSAFAYGLILWMVIFVSESIFVALNLYNPITKIAVIAFAGVFSFVTTRKLARNKRKESLCIGLGFVSMGLILDIAITYRFDSHIFQSTFFLMTYFAIIGGAIFQAFFSSKRRA